MENHNGRRHVRSHFSWMTLYVSCLLILSTRAGITSAQETQTFPAAECSYTLPDLDWVWLDTQLIKTPGLETILLVQNDKGLRFIVRMGPLLKDEPTGPQAFESYEAGLLHAGHNKLKKLGSKHLMFKNVPCYQIDLSLSGGQGSSVRILKAHGRFYELYLVNTAGPFDPTIDTEPIFQGFNFTKPPEPIQQSPTSADSKPPAMAGNNIDFERGKMAAPLCTCCFGFMAGGSIVGLIVYVLQTQNKSEPRRRD